MNLLIALLIILVTIIILYIFQNKKKMHLPLILSKLKKKIVIYYQFNLIQIYL